MSRLPYIAIEVECSGPYPGRYALLSLGACLVTDEVCTYEEARSRGHLFYAETRPHTLEYDVSALRVGCSELDVLKGKGDPYNPKKGSFNPNYTMNLLSQIAEESRVTAEKFRAFIWSHTKGNGQVCGITDTTFFDSGWMMWWLGKHPKELGPVSFHHLGLDLRSVLVGHTLNPEAGLSKLGAPRNDRPHHSGHDALHLANQTIMLARTTGIHSRK